MNLQVESTTISNRARVYHKIQEVFKLLPDQFKARDLERMCGFTTYPLHRSMVASVLAADFKCRAVGENSKRHWVKP